MDGDWIISGTDEWAVLYFGKNSLRRVSATNEDSENTEKHAFGALN